MTGEVLSAGLLGASEKTEAKTEQARPAIAQPLLAWSAEAFAQEQIRGLVRRVFFSMPERRVRQVVFSAIEPETDVQSVCKLVAEALAEETQARVAAAGLLPQAVDDEEERRPEQEAQLRRIGSQTHSNLWLVSGPGRQSASALHQYLSQIRREFEFSVVAAQARDWFESIAMSQFADGIVLVLSAQHTKRITARRMKEAIEGSRARLLGTVLTDRLFPMPEAIYRRL